MLFQDSLWGSGGCSRWKAETAFEGDWIVSKSQSTRKEKRLVAIEQKKMLKPGPAQEGPPPSRDLGKYVVLQEIVVRRWQSYKEKSRDTGFRGYKSLDGGPLRFCVG